MPNKKIVLPVLAAVVFALALWLAFRDRSADEPAPPARATAAPAASIGTGVRSAAAPASAPVASLAVASRVDDPRCVIKEAPAPTQVDASTDAASTDLAPATDAGAQASRARLLARLGASADPYANAVAAWLDVGDADDQRAARERRLAALAASTRDPRVYALALRACWKRAGRECESLSARRWSELEPGNAMPWLMMLDEASERHDVSGTQEALLHATHAARLDERAQAPVQAIVDAAPGDAESLVAARSLAIDAIGIAMAQTAPNVLGACRLATPADANTWQQCGALVDLLEHRSDSLYGRALGAATDRRMTGDAKPGRLVAQQMARISSFDLMASSSCADLRAKLAVMRRIAVEGDVVVARDLAG